MSLFLVHVKLMVLDIHISPLLNIVFVGGSIPIGVLVFCKELRFNSEEVFGMNRYICI